MRQSAAAACGYKRGALASEGEEGGREEVNNIAHFAMCVLVFPTYPIHAVCSMNYRTWRLRWLVLFYHRGVTQIQAAAKEQPTFPGVPIEPNSRIIRRVILHDDQSCGSRRAVNHTNQQRGLS